MKTWALVVLAACNGGEATSTKGPAAAARTAKVTRGTLAQRTVLTGELHAGEQVELDVPRTDVWQLTIRWMADDGAIVKKGDRLVDFDNSAVVQGLDQKKTALRDAQNQVATAHEMTQMTTAEKQFTVTQHQIAVEKAKLDASIPEDLIDRRTSQDHKLAQLKAEVALDGANRELAAQKDQSRLDEQVKQIDLEKAKRALETTEKTLTELAIKAPVDGVVAVANHQWTGKRLQIGDSVMPGMTVVTLPDLSKPMQVYADLSDVDDGKVALGETGTCTLDAFPEEHQPCTIVDLAPVARTKSKDSLRRNFAVKLSMVTKDPAKLRPGMSVRVELPPLAPAAQGTALLVPRGAVRFGETVDKRPTVATPSGDREVVLGACDAQQCVVTSGLAENDTVVL